MKNVLKYLADESKTKKKVDLKKEEWTLESMYVFCVISILLNKWRLRFATGETPYLSKQMVLTAESSCAFSPSISLWIR